LANCKITGVFEPSHCRGLLYGGTLNCRRERGGGSGGGGRGWGDRTWLP